MLKKSLLIFSLGLITMIMAAQNYVPTKDDLDRFMKTKTLLVLEDNPMMEFNMIAKNIMKQEWKITPYDIISSKEFEEKRFDPQYSFLVMMIVNFTKDKTDASYKFLHLVLGGKTQQVKNMPDICAVPLAYDGVEDESWAYKSGVLIRFMQNHIRSIQADPSLISSNVFKHYNDNIKDIKGKTLYLVADELAKDINTSARIKKIYPYKFKIVTRGEIEEAIKNRDPEVVFLHKVGPEGTRYKARCYKTIIGAADAQFYYFDYHMINDKNPDGFLSSDLKKLAKK
jgi:hypothetical protein